MDKPILKLEEVIPHLVSAVPAALAIIVGAILFNLILNRAFTLLVHKANFTREEVAPFRRMSKWFITSGAAVLILSSLGFNLGGLWTAFSTIFALVAVGFIAVWSVLSNWLCTIVILITRPFSVGDDIEFAGEPVRGRVIDLNFVYTTLLCEDDSRLQIPNNLFFQKVLKRRHSNGTVSLVQQLKGRTAAKV